ASVVTGDSWKDTRSCRRLPETQLLEEGGFLLVASVAPNYNQTTCPPCVHQGMAYASSATRDLCPWVLFDFGSAGACESAGSSAAAGARGVQPRYPPHPVRSLLPMS